MLVVETRAWRGWWFVRLPTTESIRGNKTSPVVLRWLSHTGSVDVCGRRHIKRARETGRIGWPVKLVAQIQE
jgi:hypothetical protein